MGNEVRDSKAKSVPVLNLVTATSLSSGAGSERRTTVHRPGVAVRTELDTEMRVEGLDDRVERAGPLRAAEGDPGAVLVGEAGVDVRRRVEQRVDREQSAGAVLVAADPERAGDPHRPDPGDAGELLPADPGQLFVVGAALLERQREGPVEQVHLEADLVGDPDECRVGEGGEVEVADERAGVVARPSSAGSIGASSIVAARDCSLTASAGMPCASG